MMTSLQTYVRRGQSLLEQYLPAPKLRFLLRTAGFFLLGFCLSAASLGQYPQPFVLGPVCALAGWPSALTALGSLLGFRLLWGQAGQQCMVWAVSALACSLIPYLRRVAREYPLLTAALCALIVSGTGVAFQILYGDDTPIPMYLLRVGLAAACPALFRLAFLQREPISRWLWQGIGVLSLVQLGIGWANCGFLAAGFLTASGAFPAAALAGLALELSQITKVSMTSALCLGWLVRFIPRCPRRAVLFAPAAACLAVMALTGRWELLPIPGLLAGGLLAALRSGEPTLLRRRGEVGTAQVQLEMAAVVMTQLQQLLLEARDTPVDETAILRRCAELSCGGCPARRGCTHTASVDPTLLRECLSGDADLPACPQLPRLQSQLRASRDQLRILNSDRRRRLEYRAAAAEQYRFLAQYLQELSDRLTHAVHGTQPRFQLSAQACGNAPARRSGDRWDQFSAPGCRHYVLLCDGMGTGPGAADAGRTAASMLRRMLCAGFPPQHALSSLNSLCALGEQAGIVTADLLEVQLDTGRAKLHKWGAAASFLVSGRGVEKLGAATPPPGLTAADCEEITLPFTLRPGDTLLLTSDGIPEEAVLHCAADAPSDPASLARRILRRCADTRDDATAIAVTLSRLPSEAL